MVRRTASLLLIVLLGLYIAVQMYIPIPVAAVCDNNQQMEINVVATRHEHFIQHRGGACVVYMYVR
jgi:hypothetical protein